MAAVAPETYTIGSFEILGKIAEGGMATVYKGVVPDTGILVAIKLARPETSGKPVRLLRFEQEFRVTQSLQHANIVRALEYGKHGDRPYLVLEYVDGTDLGAHIQKHKRLAEPEAIRITLQIADALRTLHKHNFIHRDIKPDNILLSSTGQAKLTDLGLVKDHGEEALELTRPAQGLGTPNYMAPEQFGDARGADERCDVYSLGATLYSMVTGQLPFSGKNHLQILKKKLQNDLVEPLKLVPSLSQRLDWTIRQALHPEPRLRPADCLEFARALTGKNEPFDLLRQVVPAKGSGAERRVRVRYRVQLESHCHPFGDGETEWPTVVTDISLTGIRMELPRRFEPKTVLEVFLGPTGEMNAPRVIVQVRWVKPAAEGQWALGCAFGRELSESEIQELIDRSQALAAGLGRSG